MRNAFAALSGVLFGAGLATSQMTNPNKVLSFLDISGGWDPSLALVMSAALAVSALAYALVLRRETTFLGEAHELPKPSGIDRRLLGGATLFGIGWGLAGFCPGPAIAATITGALPVFVFVGAMVVGTTSFRYAEAARSNRN
jgi:uncharacterized membrane protein YedE/YeeE